MNNSRRNVIKAVGTTGMIGLSGCIGEDGSISQSGDLNPAFGIITGLSGPYASLGEQVVMGMELAVKKINENGGIDGEEVEVYVEDSELDPEVSVRRAQRLIEDKDVNFIGGNVSTAAGIAVRKVAVEQNEDVLHAAAASSMDLVDDLCNPRFFNFTQPPWSGLISPLTWIADNRDVSSIYTISADYAWPQSMVEVMEDQAPEIGLEFVGNAYAPLGASDFSNQITKAMDSGADLLQFQMGGADMVKCSNQLLDFGGDEEFNVIHQPYQTKTNYEAMNSMEGFTPSGQFYWEVPDGGDWVEEFKAEYDQVPDHNSTRYHGSAIVPLQIAQELETVDPEEIAKEMEGWKADSYFKGGKAEILSRNHQMYDRWYVLEGIPESEQEGPENYCEPLAAIDTIEYAEPDQDACGAPFF